MMSGVAVEYPHKWFRENPGKKPTAIVPRTRYTGNALSRTVYRQLTTLKISSTLIRAYLYDQLHKVEEVCPEDWSSFGVSIARKGEKVSIFGMLNVVHHDLSLDAVEASEAPNDEALIANILCICRVNILPAGPATDIASAQILDRYKGIYGRDPYVPFSEKTNFKTLNDDLELMKLVAAIDMFLYRFPNNPLARLRLGTAVVRFKDCGVVKAITYVLRANAMSSPAELVVWAWTQYLWPDILRIYAEDMTEIYSLYSYFPYSVSLGISKKSPYSVTVNPAILAFCYTLSAASGDAWGINAPLIKADGMDEITENGLKVAYAFHHSKHAKQDLEDKDDTQRAVWAKKLYDIIKKAGIKLPSDKAFQERVVNHICDPIPKSFWGVLEEADQLDCRLP